MIASTSSHFPRKVEMRSETTARSKARLQVKPIVTEPARWRAISTQRRARSSRGPSRGRRRGRATASAGRRRRRPPARRARTTAGSVPSTTAKLWRRAQRRGGVRHSYCLKPPSLDFEINRCSMLRRPRLVERGRTSDDFTFPRTESKDLPLGGLRWRVKTQATC